MRSSKHSFMLKFVLLTLLVGSVLCLPTKREVDDDKQEVDFTYSGERAEVHNREPSRAFQTNAGQDSGNGTYSQLRETAGDLEVNVDGADEGASNNVGKTTGGSVPNRMIDDRMLTAHKHELDASERGEWFGWVMPEVPALFDAQDRKEKHNRNRRRKSTSGYGRKSDIVLSTSFGKEVGEDNKKDKSQALMLLDREAEDSGAKKTAVEDRPGNVREILARITDLQLYRVTEKHHEQLETEIKDVVENICESLLTEGYGAELNFQGIRRLTRSNQGLAASRLLLKSVLHGSIWECRMFWNILARTQLNAQYLITLLQTDVEKEVILQHRCNLRAQSRSMKMPKSREVSDIYINLKITGIESERESITGESNREVEIHELLKRRSSDTDKTTISVVYGAAGTGKSTLIQKIIHDWAKGMIYEEFRFVLHFKIQNLSKVKGRITLNRLILNQYPYLKNYLDYLWIEPKRLLFIFEDLDRLHQSFIFSDNERSSDTRHPCTGPESNCFVNDILRCLLQGEFLKGCSVLITARLWEQEMLRHVRADSTFQIMGFTAEKVKEYLFRYLPHGQYLNEVVQLIEDNDTLWNMSSNPLFCYTLASSLESEQPQREEHTTMSVINHTQVLFDYVVLLLRECGYDDKTTLECLLKVGELADTGIRRNTLSFEADALCELKYCPRNFTSAFMIQNRGLVYEFRHSVVRDFLAALAKILNTPKAQLIGLLDDQFTDTEGRFRTFALFLVGLSSQKSTDRLKLQLGSDRSAVTSCISEWFSKSVKRRITYMDGRYAQSMFLHILYCLLEFGDNRVMTEVLAPITSIKLNELHLTSADCRVLCRTLVNSKRIKELYLSPRLVPPEEIEKLKALLPRRVILRLDQSNPQDSGLNSLFNILTKKK